MKTCNTQPVLTESYTVRTHHLDKNSHFTMLSFCTMLLDAAGTHAHELCLSVSDLMKDNKTWMLSRFSADLTRLPHWRETVHITTWPSGIERLSALRDFEAHDADGTILGTGVSSWLVINLNNRRPLKVEPFLAHAIPETGLRSSRGFTGRLPEFGEIKTSRPFAVRRSDIDFNGHVTSTSYIAWALESVPDDITNSCIASSFDINYRAETFLGETVLSQSMQIETINEIKIMHRILRENDNQELARALSIWKRP